MPERALHDRDQVAVPRWLRRYGTMAWLLIGIVIVVAMIVFATTRIQAVFIAVFLALVVTSVLYPVVTYLSRVMPRPLATAVTLLGSVAVVVGIFTYAVETERRFYLCNAVDLKVRTEGGDVYYEVSMGDAWVWDMYRPARFVKSAKVLTFRDVSIEEIAHSDLQVPKSVTDQ